MENNNCQKWFATRVIKDRSYVLRLLEYDGWEVFRISDIPTLVFLHGTQRQIEELRSVLYDRVLFYKTPDKSKVESIPDKVIETFRILAPYHNEPVIYLPVDDPDFFTGRRKRVIKGVFKGCEGVIRRLKGDRRLIIRISDHAAIATPYIAREFLEDVE